jgi:hypothetical protein
VTGWVWEKRTTSAEGKTIRIAESSDMDSWKAVLRPCASFEKGVEFWKGYFVPVPMSWFEVATGLESGQEVVFRGKSFKRDFLPFSKEGVFFGKRFKKISYPF